MSDIVDSLFGNDTSNNVKIDENIKELGIPEKCMSCNNTMICNVLPNFLSFLRIGIVAKIDTCPYYNQIKDE